MVAGCVPAGEPVLQFGGNRYGIPILTREAPYDPGNSRSRPPEHFPSDRW